MDVEEEVDIGTIRAGSWVPLHPDYPRLPSDLSRPPLSSPTRYEGLRLHRSTLFDSDPSAVKPLSHGQSPSRAPAAVAGVLDVDFDLDVGPVLYCTYPETNLTAACKENIAFSSFPDSTVFETGSQAHSFKLALSGEIPNVDEKSAGLSERGFSYGYANFVQRRDSTSKRGYLQRSVVVLSQFALPSLFEELVTVLAPAYLSKGGPILETACQNISSWPDPSVGTSLELEFLGIVLRVRLPRNTDELQFPDPASRTTTGLRSDVVALLPCSSPVPLAVFSACLPYLWSIWELLILCEPLLVFGTSPRITSLAVWWLRDLIRPITVAGDFRPYMTIHDPDYTALINKNPPRAGLVIGVTNPFVRSVTQHWPHVISLGWEGNKPYDQSASTSSHSDPSVRPSMSKAVHLAPGPLGSDSDPGFLSQSHKRFTCKDRLLLKLWEDALKNGDKLSDVSQQFRHHFASRTASFLAPLNRYLNSLIPSPTEASLMIDNRRMKPFNVADFLSSLRTHGTPPVFRSSSKQRQFYERWLRTSAFTLWLADQQKIVADILRDPS